MVGGVTRSAAAGLVATACVITPASLQASEHVVRKGDTLIGLGKRYGVSVKAIQKANGLRGTVIRRGQRLHIPDGKGGPPSRKKKDRPPQGRQEGSRDDDDDRKTSRRRWSRFSARGENVLRLPGMRPIYVYAPRGRGRLRLKPVVVYFHARHADPQRDCRRWAAIATRTGWLVCPTAPKRRGPHKYTWQNDWRPADRAAKGAIQALRRRFGRRVQLRGNTVMGFSEGAVVGLNVGARNPRVFNRWFIQAGHWRYLGGPGFAAVDAGKARLHRIFLLTGQLDGVMKATQLLRKRLRARGIEVDSAMPKDLGHELALERKRWTYEKGLRWLQRRPRKKR